MATKTATLVENDGTDTIYPVTKASAVYMEDETKSVQSAIDTLNGITALSLTRVSNDNVSVENFNRLKAYKRGNMLTLFGNLSANYGSGFSDFATIGNISGWKAQEDAFMNVPSQNDGSKVICVAVRYNGIIQIYSDTNFTGAPFFRFCLTVPAA